MRRRPVLTALFCGLVFFPALTPPSAAADGSSWPARGYQPRACGFDMDRDGRFGEPEDCHVCDGVTPDPDGDGMAEDLIYIDCASGVNSTSCGTPGSPCRTIEYAWNTRADGPGDGAEDILCFRGSCTTLEGFSPGNGGGVPGTYTVPASGSQERDWRYPSNPTMLIGWDTDDDGVYPPVDPDESAVLFNASRSRPFRLDSDTDYLQMGHFVVRDYGRNSQEDDSGFVRFGPSSGVLQFQVFHDLRLTGINQDRRTTSETILVNLFPTNAVPQWILFDNLEVLNNGQWFARGAGYDQAPDFGPFRFINISRTSHSCNFSACGSDAASTGFKLWGYMSGIEILDSVWDGNVAAWEPKPNGGPPGTAFVFVDICSRDWLVRNNEVIDHKLPFRIKGFSADACNNAAARSVDDVVFDSNIVRNSYEPYRTGDQGVRIEPGGNSAGEWIEDVEITNNIMGSDFGWEAAIWSYAGHDSQSPPGTFLIANNTFYGDINRHAAIVLGHIEGPDQNFPHPSYVIENNIIGGFTPDDEADIAIYTTFFAGGLDANYNVYDPGAEFVWNDGSRRGLASWRGISGEDGVSRLCNPVFAGTDDVLFPLSPDDTCALDRGTLRTSTPSHDVEGEPRPVDGLDIGANELGIRLFCDGFESGDTSAWSATTP
ncbi:MAG: hypothetical protein AAGM22_09680 [Acidobacteriota bacterium]